LAVSKTQLDPAKLWSNLLEEQQNRKWLSTQEQAWLVLAANTLEAGDEMRLQQDGDTQSHQKPLVVAPDAAQVKQGTSLTNRGKQAVWAVTQTYGTPKQQPKLENPAFALQREWFHLNGRPADLNQLKQGESLIVVIRGSGPNKQDHRLLLADLLPAGIEVESASLGSTDLSAMKWLPKLSSTNFTDARDDRVAIALDLASAREGQDFAVAYRVRAVTPGSYFWPPSMVEDMYKPYLRGQGEGKAVEIQP
jgi:uncharacterized protein YfaS (alpha-2-macroglobulin family)